ncbi:hypothetical protein BJ166DRAFT_495030 [Pestalotiopsis sp. NC0098]|nr:hypothetical protein BJ166DRAFT_495030 [Pestalotiopsis sp. NC0098]
MDTDEQVNRDCDELGTIEDLAHLWLCNLFAPCSLPLAPPPALTAPVRFTTTNEDVEKCIDFTGGNDDDFCLLELLLPLAIPQVYIPTQPILQTCAAFLSQKTIHHHVSRTGGIFLGMNDFRRTADMDMDLGPWGPREGWRSVTILVSSKPNLVIANRYCHLLFHANTMIRSQSMSIYDYRPTSMGEMHSFNRRLRRKYGSVIGWKNLETLEFRSQYTTSTFTKSVCSFDITTDDSHVKRDLYTTQDTEQRLFPCK